MKPLLTLLSSRLSCGESSGQKLGQTVTASKSKMATAIAFGMASLGTIVAAAPASADSNYFDCTTGMVASGIAEADAISACASARYPEALGACVIDVNEFTGLTANSALLICQRSRRPIEVANCTISIHDAVLENPSTKVLENCGRALLPTRYGTCVVDMVDATDIGVDPALTQCLRAGYRPWRIQPRQ